MHTIKDFENFVYGTNNILDNAQFDIIEWQEHFSKELWEKNSFLANGIMKTARRVWSENGSKINNFAHCSKTNIKHIIYVENNVIVIQFLRSEIEKIAERVTKFKDDYKMFHVDIMPKNHWFLDLWGLIFGYKEWFDELIEPLQIKSTPQQKENKQNEDIKNKLWFQVGLLFAKGEMEKLKTKYNNNATQIAKHLGNSSLRPYISESISKTNTTDKNVFANNDRLLLIRKYCEENNISIVNDFLKQIKPD